MSSKKAIPVGTMFLILVIALSLLGVGYAMWQETLTIQGSVTTGEVDVEFSQYPAEECVDVNGVLTCPEPPEKANAANCTVAWSNTATDSKDNGANLLGVTVTGMYPGYHCKVSFDVTSTGSVPVHVWQPQPANIPAWVVTNFQNCYPAGVQLHQGQSTGKCTLDLSFTNADQVAENITTPITFGWTILATQWNELPTGWERVESSGMNFSGTGWGGWSCPAGKKVVGGGADNPAIAVGLAKPGVTFRGQTYPVYPHYTYHPGVFEEGVVAQNTSGTSQNGVILFAICAP